MVRVPSSGDVNQQINTNWGGTQMHQPGARSVPSPLRFEQLRQNPSCDACAPSRPLIRSHR